MDDMRLRTEDGRPTKRAKLIVSAVATIVSAATTALVFFQQYYDKYLRRAPYENNYFTDREFIMRAVTSDEHCKHLLRMNVRCFGRFVRLLRSTGELKDTIHCNIDEQVAMFLHIVSHNQRNRSIRAFTQRSGSTVSRYFNKVLKTILSLKSEFIKPPTSEIPEVIRTNLRFWPYFKDCNGAIDGTHIPAKVRAEYKPRFINRKGYPSQNVLAVCDFDLKFNYILAGWEGSASDSRILGNATSRPNGLPCLPGKFYLGDGGYPLLRSFITPHRGIAYHLNEIRGRRPRTPEELFNHRHSSLRNVVERAFGVLKKRFRILNEEPMYPYEKQIDIVLACCCVHNFIRREMADDDLLDDVDLELRAVVPPEEEEPVPYVPLSRADDAREGTRIRNELTTNMWNDFQR
ncbi:uncharacterized protein LOC143882490 [Tasmannia lanceolata]|uniref:uncharacterized protein LOC143882490 n=1 Tax=Tasmannia lanceolata TaxID=3420 RepID=UPI004064426F